MVSRLLVVASGLLALFMAQSCWPGLPIAAGIAASGGGGGSSGTGTLLAGSIILSSSESAGVEWQGESEPNDGLGRATALGRWGPTTLRGVRGQLGPRLHWHALNQEEASFAFEEDDLLHPSMLRRRTLPKESEARFIARDRDQVFVALGQNPLVVSRRGSALGHERAQLQLEIRGKIGGFAAAAGALWILEIGDAARTRLVVVDARSGERLVDLEVADRPLHQLAVTEQLSRGRLRLFTSDDQGVWEFQVQFAEGDQTVSGLRRVDLDLAPAAIGVLSYDGVFLWVGERDQKVVRAFDPDLGSQEGMLRTTAPCRSLAVALDLDLDAFQVEASGGVVDVDLLTKGTADAFWMVLDRDAALRGENPVRDFLRLGEGKLLSTSLGREPSTDVLIGSLWGSCNYELRANLGRGGVGPQAPAAGGRASASLRRAVGDRLAGLDPQRIAECWARGEIAPSVPGRLAVFRNPGVQSLPQKVGDFDLQVLRSSHSGVSLLDWKAVEEQGEPSQRFEGQPLPSSVQRNQDRNKLRLLRSLEQSPAVAWCEPVYVVRTMSTTPNDPLWPAQTWQHQAMNLSNAWDRTTGGVVRVAVVDSGIRTENTDLAPNLISGYDFVADIGNSGDDDGMDPDPYDEGGANSHGTHVAGSIAARGNNNLGVSGVMWRARVMPVRAIGSDGSGNTFDIGEAIRYAAGLANVSGSSPAQAAQVINLSLGSSAPAMAMETAIQAARAAGIHILAASGNDGISGVLYPAAYPETLGIGATDIANAKASYSNTGPQVDLVAPGGSSGDANSDGFPDMILSTLGSVGGVGNGSFGFLAGTSMACANASGAVALLLTLNPDLSPDDLQDLIEATAQDLGASGKDNRFGHGLIDVEAALEAATPILSLTATTLNFGLNGSDLVLQSKNLGGGSLEITGFTVTPVVGGAATWLAAELLSDGSTVAIQADRTGLINGPYQATLSVVSNGGTVMVTVDLTQSAGPLPDVGPVVVELRTAAGELVSRTTTTVGEVYEYALAGFALGDYFLRCGVDSDSDGQIFEVGEPQGQYPSKDAPALIQLSNLNSLSLDVVLE